MKAPTAILLLVSLLMSLGLAEFLLRATHPISDPYWRNKNPPEAVSPYVPSAFPPNASLAFRAEAGLPGMRDEPVRFTLNNLGFRGDRLVTPKPAEEIRVFMVGGSTTECLYLDDDDAVTHVLQERLREAGFTTLQAYGAGKSGDRSYDHVAMVVHRLVHLDPDVVIVFAGVNDLMAGINDADYLLLPSHSADPDWSAVEALSLLATELQLPRLAYAALKPHKYRSLVKEISWVSHYRELVELRKKLPVASELPVLDPGAYAENLLTLAGVARAHGFKLVFMTQATTWNSAIDDAAEDWQWMNAGGTAALTADGAVAFPADWMDASMESYNDVMRDVAARHNLPLFDLAAEIPKSLEFFYDDVHFNIQGAEHAGTKLAEFLRQAVLNEDPHLVTTNDSLAIALLHNRDTS